MDQSRDDRNASSSPKGAGGESVGPSPSAANGSAEMNSQHEISSHPNPGRRRRPTRPAAQKISGTFRRHLPHFEGRGNPLFITFTTKNRWKLPPKARDLVLKHILNDNGVKMHLICAVVMPDHAHVLYWPMEDEEGNRYTKGEIIGAIKSTSSHSINRLLSRKGPVWLQESFDRVTRHVESVEAKAEYICLNPVRAGLCASEDEYPWIWWRWKVEEPKAAEGDGPTRLVGDQDSQ